MHTYKHGHCSLRQMNILQMQEMYLTGFERELVYVIRVTKRLLILFIECSKNSEEMNYKKT